MKVLVH